MKNARHHYIALAGTALLAATASAAQQAPIVAPEAPWQSMTVARAGELEVRIEFLPEASLADEEWLRLAFINREQQPIELKNMSYRIESQREDPSSGDWITRGSLASGSGYDLFPWEPGERPRKAIVRPGVVRNGQHPSRYTSALLRQPPAHGLKIRATLQLQATLANDAKIATPTEGVPFIFTWSRPDADGIRAIHARLVQLLANPERGSHACHGYILDTLLEVDQARRGISLSMVAAGLAARSGGFDGRECLARRVHQLDIATADLVVYFRERLQNDDIAAGADLMQAPPEFWDDSLLEPLVKMVENGNLRERPAEVAARARTLLVLDRHHDRWQEEAAICRRIFVAVQARHAQALAIGVEELQEQAANEQWASHYWWHHAVEQLAISRHPAALELLQPYLSSLTPMYDWTRYRPHSFPNPKSRWPTTQFRVRDVALDAMLKIRYGSERRGYERLIDRPPQRGADKLASSDGVRGRAIERLRAELDK